MRSNRHLANRHLAGTKQRGFTLVEALVSLVVLSVGMLGIAGLYVEGLRANKTSIYRTTAVTLAADMADRIRANPPAPINPAAPANLYAGAGPGANNQCVNGPGPCTPAQLAQDDWWWWTQDMNNRLPAGSNATVVVGPTPGGIPTTTFTITVNWPETGQAVNSSYVLTMQL